jgi:hypothetical protein
VKRIVVVVMVLAGVLAVLVGAPLAVAEDAPQEPAAASQQPPPEDPAKVDRGQAP